MTDRIGMRTGALPPVDGGSSRLMSPVVFAQRELAKGTVITQLIPTRGAKDLLKDPQALEKHKVGEFPGSQFRGGRFTNTVYQVPVSGRDDRLEDHVIVKVGYVLPNDGHAVKFVDVGVLAKPAPHI